MVPAFVKTQIEVFAARIARTVQRKHRQIHECSLLRRVFDRAKGVGHHFTGAVEYAQIAQISEGRRFVDRSRDRHAMQRIAAQTFYRHGKRVLIRRPGARIKSQCCTTQAQSHREKAQRMLDLSCHLEGQMHHMKICTMRPTVFLLLAVSLCISVPLWRDFQIHESSVFFGGRGAK